MFAGHSLGEYTALVVAGSLSLADAVRLVRERGRLMNEAGRVMQGGMLAVIGMDEKVISTICQSAGVEIANINSPGQIVVSGAQENLARFRKLAENEGARRVIPLKVSGAFHSRLMETALDGLKQAISKCTFSAPSMPVVANVTAQPLTSATAIKEELANQILNCVQWQRSIENMVSSGVTTFLEIGHGTVLAGLIKRINPNVQMTNIGDA
jgi:[acyl-carrier-protein] S-malonyltransferase